MYYFITLIYLKKKMRKQYLACYNLQGLICRETETANHNNNKQNLQVLGNIGRHHHQASGVERK